MASMGALTALLFSTTAVCASEPVAFTNEFAESEPLPVAASGDYKVQVLTTRAVQTVDVSVLAAVLDVVLYDRVLLPPIRLVSVREPERQDF